MEYSWEQIVFILLLVDSVVALLVSWFARSWYRHTFSPIARFFPLSRGWTAYYLVLVLFIGYLTMF